MQQRHSRRLLPHVLSAMYFLPRPTCYITSREVTWLICNWLSLNTACTNPWPASGLFFCLLPWMIRLARPAWSGLVRDYPTACLMSVLWSAWTLLTWTVWARGVREAYLCASDSITRYLTAFYCLCKMFAALSPGLCCTYTISSLCSVDVVGCWLIEV